MREVERVDRGRRDRAPELEAVPGKQQADRHCRGAQSGHPLARAEAREVLQLSCSRRRLDVRGRALAHLGGGQVGARDDPVLDALHHGIGEVLAQQRPHDVGAGPPAAA